MRARPASARFRNPPGGGVKQRGHFSTRFFPLVPNPPEQRTTPSKPASTTSLTLNRSQNSREQDASIRATVSGAAIAGDEGKQQRGYKRPCSTRSSATRFPTAAQRSRALWDPHPRTHGAAAPRRAQPPPPPATARARRCPQQAASGGDSPFHLPSEPHRVPRRPQPPPAGGGGSGAGPAAAAALPSRTERRVASRCVAL